MVQRRQSEIERMLGKMERKQREIERMERKIERKHREIERVELSKLSVLFSKTIYQYSVKVTDMCRGGALAPTAP